MQAVPSSAFLLTGVPYIPVSLPAPSNTSPDLLTLLMFCSTPAGIAQITEHCLPGYYYWVRGEYLMWWMQGNDMPSLLTESPPGTPLNNAGVLGTPGVRTLIGDATLGSLPRSGLRVEAGLWLGHEYNMALQGSFFWLGDVARRYADGTLDGSRIISRPFIDATTGNQIAGLVSYPGVLGGITSIAAGTTGVMGFDAFVTRPLCYSSKRNGGDRLMTQFGYRYVGFQDRLTIVEDTYPLEDVVLGSNLLLYDTFNARNHFHGLLFGLSYLCWQGPWSLELSGRLDVGQIRREVVISGMTRVTVPDFPPVFTTGGLLTQPSNIGNYSSRDWTVIPEVELRLGCQLTRNLRLTASYNFFLFTQVARASDQIDLVVNPAFLPPNPQPTAVPARPTFLLRKNDAYLQGISLGLELFF
jgi:hypothetical protein